MQPECITLENFTFVYLLAEFAETVEIEAHNWPIMAYTITALQMDYKLPLDTSWFQQLFIESRIR